MGKLKDFEIPDAFVLKLEHEITSLERGDNEEEIARVIIADELFDAPTRDYLLGFVEDSMKLHGKSGLLHRLYFQVN